MIWYGVFWGKKAVLRGFRWSVATVGAGHLACKATKPPKKYAQRRMYRQFIKPLLAADW
jgi:hypothetical protein